MICNSRFALALNLPLLLTTGAISLLAAKVADASTTNISPASPASPIVLTHPDIDAAIQFTVPNSFAESTQLAQSAAPDRPAQPELDAPQPGRIVPPRDLELQPQIPEPLPSPEELVPPSETPPPDQAEDPPVTITVEQFEFEGNTVFSDEELAEALEPYTNQPLSFSELIEARSQITALYGAAGYTTSGAFIPPQTFEDGVVTVQIIEGQLDVINVQGLERLNPGYVRERLEPATMPLNVDQLVERLQLLQLDPLIETISAELAAGIRPGSSILEVQVAEADSFDVDFSLDNNRVPSVGTLRQRVELREANVLGDGEGLSISYSRTSGSDALDGGFQIFLDPATNSTLGFRAGISNSEVVEGLFELLELQTESYFLELTYRQPLILRPQEELAFGFTASHQETESSFLGDFLGRSVPFTSASSDDEGRTRITALRFFQDWTRRSSREIFAARSQFSLGLDLLEPTILDDRPDSRFLSWRGQGQWVRLLAPDTLFLARTDIQFADQGLSPLEQFGIGGLNNVRGYRQDLLLVDNGIFASAEARFPLWRANNIDGLLQVAPFVDAGVGWNNEAPDPDPNSLLSVGVGLLWQQGDYLSARLDWGIPLVDDGLADDSLQENGIYFSIIYTPF
jgi:hemolysin activation/secretion protein